MQERKSNIKDFIGVYDGYIPDEACDQAIELRYFQDLPPKEQLKISKMTNNYFVQEMF